MKKIKLKINTVRSRTEPFLYKEFFFLDLERIIKYLLTCKMNFRSSAPFI